MSWVRFSTVCEDGRASDLYVYEDVQGFVTVHVAKARRKGIENAPKLPEFGTTEWDHGVFMFMYAKRLEWFANNTEMVLIDLPFAGETYQYDNSQDLLEKLDELRFVGYNMPSYIFNLAREYNCD